MSVRDLLAGASSWLDQPSDPGTVATAHAVATMAIAEALLEQTDAFEQVHAEREPIGWAEVQLMGRQVVAGFVREARFAGSRFVQVDVPEITHRSAAETHYYSPGAIYGIHPSDEAAVRAAVESRLPRIPCDVPVFNPSTNEQDICSLSAGHDGDHEPLPF